jgi:hypothetical protein
MDRSGEMVGNIKIDKIMLLGFNIELSLFLRAVIMKANALVPSFL